VLGFAEKGVTGSLLEFFTAFDSVMDSDSDGESESADEIVEVTEKRSLGF
jgi:hypothetical protein